MAGEQPRGFGKWGHVGVPHKGWTCVDIEDLGEPSAICEMCETQEIRYAHQMTHPAFPSGLAVGCVCAGRLEENYEGARQREVNFRNVQARRRNWLKRKWRLSPGGNAYLNVDGYSVVVFPDGRRKPEVWSFRITNRATNRFSPSHKPYFTEHAAKLTAFEALLWVKEQGR